MTQKVIELCQASMWDGNAAKKYTIHWKQGMEHLHKAHTQSDL